MVTLINIVRNGVRPGYLPIMLRKVGSRLKGVWRRQRSRRSAERWCATREEDVSQWAAGIDASLWREAEEFADEHEEHCERELSKSAVKLGGAGYCSLVYFVTRLKKPNVVLETGVAAGHTSRCVLSALNVNRAGRLYSSDFPYVRVKEPERYIGVVVEERLRSRWTLRTKGDAKNLPEFVKMAGQIDLFHYDSDKSYEGRRKAMNIVGPYLAKEAIVIFDDIQDNGFFQELALATQGEAKVFRYRGKYVGVLLPRQFGEGAGAT